MIVTDNERRTGCEKELNPQNKISNWVQMFWTTTGTHYGNILKNVAANIYFRHFKIQLA